jgi:hypothetical protein
MHHELDTALSLKLTTLDFILLPSHLHLRLNIFFIFQPELHAQLIVGLAVLLLEPYTSLSTAIYHMLT